MTRRNKRLPHAGAAAALAALLAAAACASYGDGDDETVGGDAGGSNADREDGSSTTDAADASGIDAADAGTDADASVDASADADADADADAAPAFVCPVTAQFCDDFSVPHVPPFQRWDGAQTAPDGGVLDLDPTASISPPTSLLLRLDGTDPPNLWLSRVFSVVDGRPTVVETQVRPTPPPLVGTPASLRLLTIFFEPAVGVSSRAVYIDLGGADGATPYASSYYMPTDGGGPQVATQDLAPITLDAWHRLKVSFDPTGKVSFSIDGFAPTPLSVDVTTPPNKIRVYLGPLFATVPSTPYRLYFDDFIVQ